MALVGGTGGSKQYFPEDYVLNMKDDVIYADRNKRTDIGKVNPNSSFADVWDDMCGELTEGGALGLGRAKIKVDDQLEIYKNNIALRGMGRGITILENIDLMNKDMFKWKAGAFYHGISMMDLTLLGNEGEQGAGTYRGINADISGDCSTEELFNFVFNLVRVQIKQFKGHGLFFKSATGTKTGLHIERCGISENGNAGDETVDMYIERTSDGIVLYNFTTSIELVKGISTYKFIGNYYGGGGEEKVVHIHGGTVNYPFNNNIFKDFMDNPNNAGSVDSGCLVLDDYCVDNDFFCKFGRLEGNSTTGISAQVLVKGYSTRNYFDCTWTHPELVTRQYKNAIWEQENADLNTYIGKISKKDKAGNLVYADDPEFWIILGDSDVEGLRAK